MTAQVMSVGDAGTSVEAAAAGNRRAAEQQAQLAGAASRIDAKLVAACEAAAFLDAAVQNIALYVTIHDTVITQVQEGDSDGNGDANSIDDDVANNESAALLPPLRGSDTGPVCAAPPRRPGWGVG